jgi:hypothetical protein
LLLNAGSGAAIARPTFSRDFAGEKTLNNGTGPAITFTRASNATFFDANGTLQTASNDTPRFDHSGGSNLGLLIEEARTNLLLNSATLATQTITVTAVAHTLSFYGTGEVVLSGAHSVTVTGTGAFPTRTSLTFTPSAGSLTATVSGTVEYAQLEVGAFATSYITTTGATATRSADSAVVTPISSFYNQAEGTLFAEFVVNGLPLSTQFPKVWSFGNTTNTNNRTEWFLANASGTLQVGTQVRVASVNQYGVQANASAVGLTGKFAMVYKTDDFQAAQNGSLFGAADTSGSVPASADITQFNIGSQAAGVQPATALYFRKIAYWPRRLSNTLLQQLTT